MTVDHQTTTNGRGSAADDSGETSSSPSSPVLVLYRITNCKSDSPSPQYNAFQIPKQQLATSGQRTTTKNAMTLSHVKQHMAPILQTLNEVEGSDGYHFRVLVNSLWCDATKNSDFLPFQSMSAGEMQRLLDPTAPSRSASTNGEEGPKMDVLVLKLLDMTKLRLEECQRKLLKQKLREMTGKSRLNTTQSAAKPSVLSSPSLLDDGGAAKKEEKEALLELASSLGEEEKKEEESPSPISPQLRIEDHPLAFACKPSLRESVLSSSLDDTLVEEVVEDEEVEDSGEEEQEEEEKEQLNIDNHPLAFATKPALRESVLSTSYCRSSDAPVEEAVEAVLDPVSITEENDSSIVVAPASTPARSTPSLSRPTSSLPPTEKQRSSISKSSSSVAAKTTIVSEEQNEVECVLTRSPHRRNHQSTQVVKKAENKTPSSAISSPCYKQHPAKISTRHHKNHKINVRSTSPTASPTPNQRNDRAYIRSNSPSSVADFADPAPTPAVTETKSKHVRHSHLRVPDISLGQPAFAMKQRSSTWAKSTTELPVAGVATKMTTTPSQNPTTARLTSSAPPAFRLHSGWEETLGLASPSTAAPKVRQHSPPVHRKLSWEEAITGSISSPSTTAVMQSYQPQQQSFAPHVPATHCLV